MTFLEALYGSQYYEIQKQGKDGNKGRLNGNLFLAAFIILIIFAVLMLGFTFVPGFSSSSSKVLTDIFGHSNGKMMGKILAIPLLAVIYYTITKTAGSQQNFTKHTAAFMSYPDEVKAKANAKLLLPFFFLLFVVFGLAMFNSYR